MSEHSFNMQIPIPQVTPEGKRRALALANLRVGFEVNGKAEEYTLDELTDEVVQAEAERIAAIADPTLRAKEVFQNMAWMFQVLHDAQEVGEAYSGIADRLEELKRFLSTVKELRPDPPEDGPPAPGRQP